MFCREQPARQRRRRNVPRDAVVDDEDVAEALDLFDEDDLLPAPPELADPHNVALQHAFQFHADMHGVMFPDPCEICNESWPNMVFVNHNQRHVCRRCHSTKHQDDTYHYLSTENNTNPSFEVPAVLNELSLVEESLISIVNPLLRVVRLPYRGIGYAGHVCTFSKDLDDICYILPRLTADIVVVRRTDQAAETRDFRIRREVVMNALVYLCTHHRDYREKVRIDWGNLDRLPENGFYRPEDVELDLAPDVARDALGW